MKNNVKRCPFCGSADTHIENRLVFCENQKCEFQDGIPIDIWNTRPLEPTILYPPFTPQMFPKEGTRVISVLENGNEQAGRIGSLIKDDRFTIENQQIHNILFYSNIRKLICLNLEL